MKCDILIAGVGGQGVLSMAALIGRAAIEQGWHAKQSEVHGMAQRGGAVTAHLRLSTEPIASELVPQGAADLVLSLEPLESLRYVGYLGPHGTLATSVNPVVNIPDYPGLEAILARVRALPSAVTVDAEALARAAGDVQALNTVMVGAVAGLLPFPVASLEQAIRRTFASKGPRVLEINLEAFAAGRKAAA